MPLVASNAHISASLFHPRGKIVYGSKRYVPTVPMIMTFKYLKYYLSGRISFFLFASRLRKGDYKPEKLKIFSEILTHATVGLIEKRLLFPGKKLVCS